MSEPGKAPAPQDASDRFPSIDISKVCSSIAKDTLKIASKGRGQKKILVFFDFLSKGGRGGLGQSKKSLSENTQIFLTKGGGSHPIQKGFIRKTEIFWHRLGWSCLCCHSFVETCNLISYLFSGGYQDISDCSPGREYSSGGQNDNFGGFGEDGRADRWCQLCIFSIVDKMVMAKH